MSGPTAPQRQMLTRAVDNGGRIPPSYERAVQQVRLHLERAGWMDGWQITSKGRAVLSPASLQIRLWTRIQQPEGSPCWEWQGYRTPEGYGSIKTGKKTEGTHRVAYRLVKGEIPDGLVIMHSCDNPPCCNPAHLSLGTPLDNNNDKVTKGRHYVPTNGPATHRAQTHCRNGHEYTPENTHRDPKDRRRCRACGRAQFHKQKAAATDAPVYWQQVAP